MKAPLDPDVSTLASRLRRAGLAMVFQAVAAELEYGLSVGGLRQVLVGQVDLLAAAYLAAPAGQVPGSQAQHGHANGPGLRSSVVRLRVTRSSRPLRALALLDCLAMVCQALTSVWAPPDRTLACARLASLTSLRQNVSV